MIGNKQQNTNSNLSKHQFIATTCLGPNKMSTTTALKAHSHHQHHHTAAMAPSFEHKNNNNSKASMTMSSLAADLCKAAAAVKQSPPMEAVVVNSIIYSKPSFCSIVVDIGGRGNTTSTMAASCSGPTAAKFVGATKDKEISEQIPTNRTQQKETTWATTDKTFAPFANDGYFPLATTTPATAARTNAHNLPEDEAHVYMMCTTMNGSIHHHISELCDNLISMGLFGMTNSEHDDDSLIEFAYDDDDDLNQTDDHDNEDEDEEDEDEDEVETETEDEDEDCENDVDDYCLYDDGEDVVDFVRTCPIEKAPNEFYCDKKKKVRFNTKPVVHVMHAWDYAYRAARKGNWEMYARDRGRFKRRICETASILNRILEPEHRLKIYENRFAKIYNAVVTPDEPPQEEKPKKKKIPVQPPPNANTKAKKRQRLKKRRRRKPNF